MWGTTRDAVGPIAPSAEQQRASREAHTIRTAFLVLGILLAFGGGVGIILSLFALSYNYVPSGFRAINLANGATSAVFLVLGVFLVRMASDRREMSVRNLIFPALTLLGVYLILTGASPLITFIALDAQWGWGYALQLVIELPWIFGGAIVLWLATRRHEDIMARMDSSDA